MKTLGHLSLSVLLAIVFMAAFPFIGYAGEPETVSCSYVVFDGVDAVEVSWDPAVTDAHKYKVVLRCVEGMEVTAYVGFTTGDCYLFLDSDGDCDQTATLVTVDKEILSGANGDCTALVRTLKKAMKGSGNNGQGKNYEDPWSESEVCADSAPAPCGIRACL